LRMFNRMRTPLFNNLRVQWPDGATPHTVAMPVRTAFDGDTLHVSGWFDTPPRGKVALLADVNDDMSYEICHAMLNTDNLSISLPVSSGGAQQSMALSRLAAAQLLDEMENGPEEDIWGGCQIEILEDDGFYDNLAVRYQLITLNTSFLLTHQRPDATRATDMPTLHQVKQMSPAGWGGSTVHDLQCIKQVVDIPVANLYRKSFDSVASHQDSFSKKSVEITSNYEIPAFLRRGVDEEQTHFNTGDTISLRRSQFWFKLTDSGKQLRALLHRRRAGQGVRIWFFNDQDEAFELIDCADRATALKELHVLGYSRMPRGLKDLLPTGTIELTWVDNAELHP